MPRQLDQSDFNTIEAAANKWPDPWPDRFRERVAIIWTDAGHVVLAAWREAYSLTIEEAHAESVELPDHIPTMTFEERRGVVRWNTRPQDVPAGITGIMRMR